MRYGWKIVVSSKVLVIHLFHSYFVQNSCFDALFELFLVIFQIALVERRYQIGHSCAGRSASLSFFWRRYLKLLYQLLLREYHVILSLRSRWTQNAHELHVVNRPVSLAPRAKEAKVLGRGAQQICLLVGIDVASSTNIWHMDLLLVIIIYFLLQSRFDYEVLWLFTSWWPIASCIV